MIYRDFMIFRNVKWKFIQFLYFPITTIVIWGLFAVFVQSQAAAAGLVVLVVNVFWNFANLAQNTINSQMMEDIWSGSFRPVLSSGISETEYMLARIFSASLTALGIVALMLLLGLEFGMGIYYKDMAVFLYLIALSLVSSIGLSIIIAALILTLGIEYGFLSWSALHIFVLLSAPFYPVSIFPGFVQVISWFMPFTNIFEAVRAMTVGTIPPELIINGTIVTAGYLIFSYPLYLYVFRCARKNGKLIKISD
jgi:ABC-2 type transport system permease protein